MPDPRTLSHQQAKEFYDRFGRKQDAQEFYERHAVRDLIEHADFEHARRVLEVGCGTGKLAAELLEERLTPDATYLGLDLSSTMVALTRERTARFGARMRCEEVDGHLPLPTEAQAFDRFVACYLFDLLADAEIDPMLAEARRSLRPGGLLCLVGLTHGTTLVSRVVSYGWNTIHRFRPHWVGGCRPLALAERLPRDRWYPLHHRVVVTFGVASEVIVARRAA